METENKYTVVLTGAFKPNGMESPEFKEYSQRSQANVAAHGGITISKNMIEKNLGNGETPHVVFVVEFPSKEKAIEAFSNDEYVSIISLRDVAFEFVNILITK